MCQLETRVPRLDQMKTMDSNFLLLMYMSVVHEKMMRFFWKLIKIELIAQRTLSNIVDEEDQDTCGVTAPVHNSLRVTHN